MEDIKDDLAVQLSSCPSPMDPGHCLIVFGPATSIEGLGFAWLSAHHLHMQNTPPMCITPMPNTSPCASQGGCSGQPVTFAKKCVSQESSETL